MNTYADLVPPPPHRRQKPAAGDEATAGLTGGGPSQLGVNGSMRARDVSRPREVDIEQAEQLVQVSYRPHARSTSRPAAPAQETAPAAPAQETAPAAEAQEARPAVTAQEPGSGGSDPVSS